MLFNLTEVCHEPTYPTKIFTCVQTKHSYLTRISRQGKEEENARGQQARAADQLPPSHDMAAHIMVKTKLIV